MPVRLLPLAIIGALTLAVVTVLGWQRHTAHSLRAELDRQRTNAADRAQQSRQRELVAARAHAEEMEQAIAERAAVAHLRKELESLRRRAQAPTEARSGAEPDRSSPALTANVLPFTLWRNRGSTTPEASLETALWASANGDIDTLAHLLVFDPESQNEAATLFAQLPENFRREFVSPERLIAFLAAKDVPLGSATILSQYPSPTETKLQVQIFDAEEKHKLALLSLRPDDAGWRFVVPTSAVKRYAAWLRGPANSVIAGDPVTAK